MNFIRRSLVFIVLVISPLVSAQGLQGKWIVSGNKSFGAFPGIHVMQISDDSLSHYNFDKFMTRTSYNIEDDLLKIDTLAFAQYSFINPNRLSISSERLENPIDYIRLVPTETDLNAEEIEQIRYRLQRGGESFEVDFQNRSQGKITHSYLKKIDQTYFLMIYRHGKPVTAVPIEKITKDSLSLYGFARGPNRLVAKAIE